MLIKSLYLENFRLFETKKIELSQEKTLILGENGTGKTSILESLEILFSGKSFRSKNSTDCIKQGRDFFKLDAAGTLFNKELRLSTSKTNTGRISTRRMLATKKLTVSERPLLQIVLAKHLRMIEGEPDLRRDFMNGLMFHVKPEVSKLHNKYNKALSQRNRALRKKLPIDELATWTDQLIDLGMLLSKEQYNFFQDFKKYSLVYISKVVASEGLTFLHNTNMHFISGWDTKKTMVKAYQDSLPKDMVLGYTTQGPHRQDFVFSVDKKSASNNLSRGQSKILIILLFLSSYEVLRNLSEGECLLLIDDITSELDEKNINIILKLLAEAKNQVVITAIAGSYIDKISHKLKEFKRINI